MNHQRFYLLVSVTILSLGVLLFAIKREAPVFEQTKLGFLLPELGQQLDEVARIEITHGLGLSGTQRLIFERKADASQSRWVVVARDNYPANQELVNETILSLSTIEKLAPRTRLSKWHRALGLTPPDDLSVAIEFKVFDNAGAPIASVLLGNDEKSEAEQKQTAKQVGVALNNFYIRKANEDQTWLARGRLPRNKDITPWIDPNLDWPDFAQVVSISYAGTNSLTISREDVALPWPNQVASDIIARLSALRPLDVVKVETIDFTSGQSLILSLKGGDTFTIKSVTTSSNFWVRLNGGDWAYKFDGAAREALIPIF